jgi:hypothetical protein
VAGVPDAFGHDQPNHDPPANDKSHEEKNKSQTGAGFVHAVDIKQDG